MHVNSLLFVLIFLWCLKDLKFFSSTLWLWSRLLSIPYKYICSQHNYFQVLLNQVRLQDYCNALSLLLKSKGLTIFNRLPQNNLKLLGNSGSHIMKYIWLHTFSTAVLKDKKLYPSSPHITCKRARRVVKEIMNNGTDILRKIGQMKQREDTIVWIRFCSGCSGLSRSEHLLVSGEEILC